MSDDDKDIDIHGTDQKALPRVVGVGRLIGFQANDESRTGVMVSLNFEPTDDQLRTLEEHLRSWHP